MLEDICTWDAGISSCNGVVGATMCSALEIFLFFTHNEGNVSIVTRKVQNGGAHSLFLFFDRSGLF